MGQPVDLTIYRLPNGWEAVAVTERDRIFLYLPEEKAEGAVPSLYYDPKIDSIRFRGFDDVASTGKPDTWTTIFPMRALEATDRTIVNCDWCGYPVWEPESCPHLMHEEIWARMALEHAEDCEWIRTRAFRL